MQRSKFWTVPAWGGWENSSCTRSPLGTDGYAADYATGLSWTWAGPLNLSLASSPLANPGEHRQAGSELGPFVLWTSLLIHRYCHVDFLVSSNNESYHPPPLPVRIAWLLAEQDSLRSAAGSYWVKPKGERGGDKSGVGDLHSDGSAPPLCFYRESFREVRRRQTPRNLIRLRYQRRWPLVSSG